MMFASLPSRNNQFKVERCVFCEFIKNSGEFEELELEDEKMYLNHMSVSHGLER
ncbi:MAG TPA: hypothetical protein VNE86_07490 [Nitrososphaerales archaeon]|nr:hypothetical protein [Nitrososphaerales archaeon]